MPPELVSIQQGSTCALNLYARRSPASSRIRNFHQPANKEYTMCSLFQDLLRALHAYSIPNLASPIPTPTPLASNPTTHHAPKKICATIRHARNFLHIQAQPIPTLQHYTTLHLMSHGINQAEPARPVSVNEPITSAPKATQIAKNAPFPYPLDPTFISPDRRVRAQHNCTDTTCTALTSCLAALAQCACRGVQGYSGLNSSPQCNGPMREGGWMEEMSRVSVLYCWMQVL